MVDLQQLEQQISELSEEQARGLLSMLVRSRKFGHWPSFEGGIEHTQGVCGGAATIRGTRIPVWVLEQLRRLGSSDADLLQSYPTLRAIDLANAWWYVEAHQAEIDEDIRSNEEDEDEPSD